MEKNDIRALLLKGEEKPRKTVSIKIDGNEFEVDVVQASLKERDFIYNKTLSFDEDGNIQRNSHEAIVWTTIALTRYKGTDEPVFTEADFEALYATVSGGSTEKISEVITQLSIVDEEEIKKN